MEYMQGKRLVFLMIIFLAAAVVPVATIVPAVYSQGDMLVVHYHRFDSEYGDWTLWTWEAETGIGAKEVQRSGSDDFGLIFQVKKSDYGRGQAIGLLPKYKEWERKDPPDRIWKAEMGDQVYILSGYPELFTSKPGEDMMVMKDVGSITVHYHRPRGDYDGWTLWTWNDATDQDSREIMSSGSDAYGLIFKVDPKMYGDGTQIGLLPKFGNWADKDGPDRIWYPFKGPEVWILAGDDELFTEIPDITPRLLGAFVDGKSVITLSLSTLLEEDAIVPGNFAIKDENGAAIPVTAVREVPPRKGSIFLVGATIGRELDVRTDPIPQYTAEVAGFKPANLTYRGILDLPEFHSDKVLGATYTPQGITIRVFAPTATSVQALFYAYQQGGRAKAYDMQYAGNGVWEVSVPGDAKGTYYTVKAEGWDPRLGHEVIEPYSRCESADKGRSFVFVDETPIADPPSFDMSEAIIYEIHVRDFTIGERSGVKEKGKYLGFTERGTLLTGTPEIVETCLDHLVELGVNVVHLLPIQDFENDEHSSQYNWGYMPVHFNSPDGWYATETYNAKRVEEFKRLVDALHKAGIKVVMDVVYNHTAEYAPNKIYSFEGLVPGYYYRLKDDGSYWNGSGTGNEIRSEAPMMRKFILDSVKYWATEYKVDGFRFDLMGLMETMKEIVKELRALNPEIIIYGEPWTGGETPITPLYKGAQKGQGFAVFNDHFRDAIKGGVFDLKPGYVQAGVSADKVKKGIEGAINDFTQDPTETINYVASHDNRTFWDRLVATTKDDRRISDSDRKRMDRLGAAIIFTSQGIPFIQGGQEILRTKQGDQNSYNKPDAINAIRWQWKMDNTDIFEYYKGLIALRKAHPMFRMKTRAEVEANLKFLDDDLGLQQPVNCVGYHLTKGNSGDTWDEVLVLLNPSRAEEVFRVPGGKDWIAVVDEDEAGTEQVHSGKSKFGGDKIKVPKMSAMVLYR
jgi:pullulanase